MTPQVSARKYRTAKTNSPELQLLVIVTTTSVIVRVVNRLLRQRRHNLTYCIYIIPRSRSSSVLDINAIMSDVNLSKMFSLDNKVALVTGGKTFSCAESGKDIL